MDINLKVISLGLMTTTLLLGCAAEPASWPWKVSADAKLAGCSGVCTTPEMYESVIAATSFCRQVSNFYENTGNDNSRVRLGVKVLGIFAGSVFGVTAGGTAAKAWSSLSGATNGIQTDLGDEALVRSNRAKAISGLLDKFHAEIKDSLSANTIGEADRAKVVLASISVSGRCATYSQELPVDETAKMEKKIAEINKLASEKMKTPEQIAADKLANDKEAEKLKAADEKYNALKAEGEKPKQEGNTVPK